MDARERCITDAFSVHWILSANDHRVTAMLFHHGAMSGRASSLNNISHIHVAGIANELVVLALMHPTRFVNFGAGRMSNGINILTGREC